MELARYLAIIRRWWWTIVVATWAAGLAAYLTASQLPATYEAEATVLVGPVSADFETQRASGQLVETYAEIVRSRPIVRATIEELGLPDSDASLARRITAIADSTTRFLTVRAQYGDPQTAADIANDLVAQLSQQTSSATIRPEGEPQLWEEATPNPEPVAPEIGLMTFLAGAAGLVAALVLVVAVEYIVAPVRDPAGLALASGTDAMAVVDTWRPRGSAARGKLLVEVAPDSPAAVAYRLLARRLRSMADGSIRSVCIVSAGPRIAAGEIAANIAAAGALRGDRVALVDANDDDQEVSRLLGRWGQRGIDDVLERGPTALAGLVGMDEGLQVVGHGPRVALPLIDDADARAAIEAVRERGAFDIVIVDAGVATAGSNAVLWASGADAAIIVAKRDQTRGSEIARAAELVTLSGANVVGAILHARRLRNVKFAAGRHRRPDAGDRAQAVRIVETPTLPAAGPPTASSGETAAAPAPTSTQPAVTPAAAPGSQAAAAQASVATAPPLATPPAAAPTPVATAAPLAAPPAAATGPAAAPTPGVGAPPSADSPPNVVTAPVSGVPLARVGSDPRPAAALGDPVASVDLQPASPLRAEDASSGNGKATELDVTEPTGDGRFGAGAPPGADTGPDANAGRATRPRKRRAPRRR